MLKLVRNTDVIKDMILMIEQVNVIHARKIIQKLKYMERLNALYYKTSIAKSVNS